MVTIARGKLELQVIVIYNEIYLHRLLRFQPVINVFQVVIIKILKFNLRNCICSLQTFIFYNYFQMYLT